MSIFIRDEINNTGANTNPDFLKDKILNQDNTSINNALTNPNFINQVRIGASTFTNLPVPLVPGWNTIAFTGLSPMPVRDFLRLIFVNHNTNNDNDFDEYLGGENTSLNQNQDPNVIIQIFKDFSGNQYWPRFGYNSIGDLLPGRAYLIRISKNRTTDNLIATVVQQNRKNGFLILPGGFNGSINPPQPLISTFENIESILEYNTQINNININFENNLLRDGGGWTYVGFPRAEPQSATTAFYLLFFPNGHPSHSNHLDANNLPIPGNSFPKLGGMGDANSSEPGYNATNVGDNFTFNTQNGIINDALGLIFINIKNNVGKTYLPAFNFNGIGDLIPGEGYLLKSNVDSLFNSDGSFTGVYIPPEELKFPPDPLPNIGPLIDGGPR